MEKSFDELYEKERAKIKEIPCPEEIDPNEWALRQEEVAIIWSVWKEIGQYIRQLFEENGYIPEEFLGPDCLDGETVLGYIRHLYEGDRMMEILKHLASCPYCSLRVMEMRKEDWADIPKYVHCVSEKLDLSEEVVRRAMENASREANKPLNYTAGIWALGIDYLPREEIVRLASLPTQETK